MKRKDLLTANERGVQLSELLDGGDRKGGASRSIRKRGLMDLAQMVVKAGDYAFRRWL